MDNSRVFQYILRLFLLMPIFIILSLSVDAFAFNLPDTGQTKCYDSAGTEIACVGTGQDGEYNINPMSYTDHGNGTVTDNNTGLMWQKQSDVIKRNWTDAVSYCDNMTLAGFTDWRLPTKKELVSIINYAMSYPIPTNDPIFADMQPVYPYYWSSVTYTNNIDSAWIVNFGIGSVGYMNKSYPDHYVRCVRAEIRQAEYRPFNKSGNLKFPSKKRGAGVCL